MARPQDTERSAQRNARWYARLEIWMGLSLLMAGLVLTGFALTIATQNRASAQGTASPDSPSLQRSAPMNQMQKSAPPEGQTSGSGAPAESKPGGTRPTTPAPEPARPDADAQNAGAPTALPAAPAEKIAPPITTK